MSVFWEVSFDELPLVSNISALFFYPAPREKKSQSSLSRIQRQ